MKRIIIFVTTFVLLSNLAFGQIEEFDSSMLTNQQKTTKQVVNKTLCDVDYPATLNNNINCKHPNLIGHQVYCTKTSISTDYKKTKQSIPLMMVSMNSEENTLTIVKYFKERYYHITDVLYLKDEIIDLKTTMENCQNFVSDTIYYYHPNSKILQELTKNDVFTLLDFDKIIEYQLNIYVLEDTIGNKYYVSDTDSWLLLNKWRLQNGDKIFRAGRSVMSSDFISATTYGFIKDTFEGKDVIDLDRFIRNELWRIEDTSYYITDKYSTIDKVAVKDGKIVVVYTKNDGKKHVYDYYSTNKKNITGRYSENTDVYTLYYKEYETSGFLKKEGEFMLLSDAQNIVQKEKDALLAKKQREELQRQEREERARAEQQKQEQERLERKQEKLAQEQARRAELIKKYGEKDGLLIADGKIFIGMTKEQLLDSKGNPCDKKVTTNTLGTYEIWTYNCFAVSLGWGSYYYVHLSNNKVVQIDE